MHTLQSGAFRFFLVAKKKLNAARFFPRVALWRGSSKFFSCFIMISASPHSAHAFVFLMHHGCDKCCLVVVHLLCMLSTVVIMKSQPTVVAQTVVLHGCMCACVYVDGIVVGAVHAKVANSNPTNYIFLRSAINTLSIEHIKVHFPKI